MSIKKILPKQGQESVWDYPRPPITRREKDTIWIAHANTRIAQTQRAISILETSHPPTYYLPPEDIDFKYLKENQQSSFCEFKGMAKYYDLVIGGEVIPSVAWAYASPNKNFIEIKGYLAFFAHKLDKCFVGDEQAMPQAGGFYGGWITSKVVGPFKGEAGTWGW